MQCSLGHSCHVLVSFYRHRENKFSKLISEGPLANLCHVSVSILPLSWLFCHHLDGKIDTAYFILRATDRSGQENKL